MRTICKILVGGTQRKKPHGRPRRRKEDNIKMTLKETERKKASLDSRGFHYSHNKTRCINSVLQKRPQNSTMRLQQPWVRNACMCVVRACVLVYVQYQRQKGALCSDRQSAVQITKPDTLRGSSKRCTATATLLTHDLQLLSRSPSADTGNEMEINKTGEVRTT